MWNESSRKRCSYAKTLNFNSKSHLFSYKHFYSHPKPEQSYQWKTLQTSLSKKSLIWLNQDPTKRADTDPPPCQFMLVYTQHIYICIEVRSMIIALVVTHKYHHSVMDSASGVWLDADLSLSMLTLLVISNCAIVNCQQTLHFAMVPISICSDGQVKITEVSGVFGESSHSGAPSPTGCSPSTSER